MNKHLLPQKSTLFENKLKKILESINRSRETEDLQTKEAYTLEATRLLASFYQTVDQSNFLPESVRVGTAPNRETYNTNLELINDDLQILFLELENVEGVIIENFNLFATHSNRLSSRVKRLSSKVTDFALFSRLPIKNSFFFSDTFSDLSKIDLGSNLLNAEECEINQVEGVLTLPVNRGATEVLEIVETPLINSNSNGREGNNEEVGAQLNNNISALFDSNSDTWFEYERVLQEDDDEALVFDFTVNTGSSQIINFIRINPNNFGTKTEVEILDISTSVDGQLYMSVKDDIPIAGFLIEDEENVFKLAPSTSKFAGQGLYTFTPRYAKYVKVTLRQSTPYLINTVQGQQFRYAIGIRDFEIQRIAYQAAGEAVSVEFQTSDEIKKIALQTNQSPLQKSELAEVRHQLSFDNGNTWNDVSPLTDDGFINTDTTVQEVININTEDSNSINTDTPVLSLRYKSILSRDDAGFTDSSTSFVEQIAEKTELKIVPQQEPWFFQLDNNPLVGSISVIDPSYGSRDVSGTKYLVGKGTGQSVNFSLPFDDLRTDLFKVSNGTDYDIEERFIQRVFVDGTEWTRVPTLASALSTSEFYVLTKDNDLQFGNGTNGKSPGLNSNIEVLFTEERIYPVGKNDHKSEIQFPTSIDKDTVQVVRRGEVVTNIVEASKNAQIHRLEHRNIQSLDSIMFAPSSQSVFTNRIEFQNGLIDPEGELLAPGDWSIDEERGIIYSFDRVEPTETITICYTYKAEEVLLSSQWIWGDEDPLHHSVQINEDAWVPNTSIGTTAIAGLSKVLLPKLSVIEGSININKPSTATATDDPFLEEVTYIDGSSELNQIIRREEEIPSLVPVGPSTVATFVTSTPVTTSGNFAIAFEDTTLFATEVAMVGDVNSTGEYFIDRSTNTTTVFTNGVSISSPGKVFYYSTDPDSIPDGAYSVDYKRGEVHCQRLIPETGYSLDFNYADYIIRYNIAREVPEVDWELDSSAGAFQIEGDVLSQKATVTILPNEILRKAKSPSLVGNGLFIPTVYQVNYQYIDVIRQNITDLAPYFSPVLKDYALQIITKGFL